MNIPLKADMGLSSTTLAGPFKNGGMVAKQSRMLVYWKSAAHCHSWIGMPTGDMLIILGTCLLNLLIVRLLYGVWHCVNMSTPSILTMFRDFSTF